MKMIMNKLKKIISYVVGWLVAIIIFVSMAAVPIALIAGCIKFICYCFGG